MPRRLRYIPYATTPYEFTYRAREGRLAFVPEEQLVKEWVGILRDASDRYPGVKLHQIALLSNHVTGMLSVDHASPVNQLALWEAYVFGQTARVSQAVHDLKGEIWESRRCRFVPLLDEESVRRSAKYIMAQAVAADLVARPNRWPGLNTCDAVCRGTPVRGYRANAALRRQAALDKVPLATIAPTKTLKLEPLPMHAELSDYDRRKWYREIEREIIDEAAERNAGRILPTIESLRRRDAHQTIPQTPSNPPTDYARADNHAARTTWRAAMKAFVAAWRDALAAWVNGAKPCFPEGGWVPFAACGSTTPAIVQLE